MPDVKNKKKKEKKVQDLDAVIKRSTALIIAAVCLVVGFLAGVFYSTGFSGGRKVRKMTVKQPVPPARVPHTRIPVTAPAQSGAISTLEKEVNSQLKSSKNLEAAKVLGKVMAERLKKIKVKTVVFDRNVYDFKGRVKLFADSVRENGIKF